MSELITGLTLSKFKKMFPKDTTRRNFSIAKVPMNTFLHFEDEFRFLMKKHKLRTFYRGTRVNNDSKNPTNTMRCDADSVVFYHK